MSKTRWQTGATALRSVIPPLFPSHSTNRNHFPLPAAGRQLLIVRPHRIRPYVAQDRCRLPQTAHADQVSPCPNRQNFPALVFGFRSRPDVRRSLYGCFCFMLATMDLTSGGTARPLASRSGGVVDAATLAASALRARRF